MYFHIIVLDFINLLGQFDRSQTECRILLAISREAFEKVCGRYPENFTNIPQAAGTDPICPPLIFLNLLKTNSQVLFESFPLPNAVREVVSPHVRPLGVQ